MNRPVRLIPVIVLLGMVVAAKARDFSIPRAFHAKTYPARETHDDERFSIAVDPYDLPDKASPVFSIDYLKEGLLPVQVIYSNDGDSTVTISQVSVTFITRKRDKITAAAADDIYRRIAKQVRRGDEPKVVDIPIPIKKKPRSVSQQAQEEVEAISVHPKAVEPKSTQSAIYVFDVETLEHPLAGAKIVITGIRRDGQELFYFEIPMEKYLSYNPTAQPQ